MLRQTLGRVALFGVALGVPSAFAADMPLKAPPPPAFSWTGCYVGGNAGYAWGQTSGFNGTPTTVFFGTAVPETGPVYRGSSPNGGALGFQDGCNYQVGQWVLGVEADFDGLLNEKGQGGPSPAIVNPINPNSVGKTTELFQSTYRARLGFTGWNNRVLVYVTGGGALMNVTSTQFITGHVAGSLNSQNDTPFGWTVGAGLEYAVTNQWLLRAEYLFVQIPTYTTFLGGAFLADPPVPLRISLNQSIARVGLSYKWWGP